MRLKFYAGLFLSTLIGLSSFADRKTGKYTYAKLFNSASGLFPPKVEEIKSPAQDSVTVSGGKIAFPGKKELTVTAENKTATLSWKVPRLRHYPKGSLKFSATSAAPAEIVVYSKYGSTKNKCGKLAVTPGKPAKFKAGIATGELSGVVLEIISKSGKNVKLTLQDIDLSCWWWEGCFRKEFTLPEEKIWEAVVCAGNMTTVYVNGKEVTPDSVILPHAFYFCRGMFRSKRLNLKPHLKPGKNVIELYAIRKSIPPYAYLNGAVIMDSGKRIPLKSDGSWKWSVCLPGTQNAVWKKLPAWRSLTEYRRAGTGAGAFPITGYYALLMKRGDMPAYSGLMKLVNPYDDNLFYPFDKPFAVKILIPPGLANRNPVAEWQISRFENDKLTPVISGKIDKFKKSGNSLKFSVNGGKLPAGVYTFGVVLKSGNKVIESRIPEPFAVPAKIKQKEVAGDTLEQGMDLQLETTVDFTKPNGPWPWMETDAKAPYPGPHIRKWDDKFVSTVKKPLIVEKNGLKYRVTRKKFNAQFTYKIDFKHPGDWYLMVLEYPDDAERWIGVACNASARMNKKKGYADEYAKCGPCIWTGGKYPNSGKMLKMKWLYRPDPGPHGINVMSLMTKSDAAASKLLIYHIRGELPALKQPSIPLAEQRKFGLLSERTTPWHCGFYNYLSSHPKSFTGMINYRDSAVLDACRRTTDLLDTCYHYAQYLKFSGQNLHVMGCYQYHDMNTCPRWNTGSSRINYNSRDIAARVFQANGIDFYASVEYMNAFKRMAKYLTRIDRFFIKEDPELFFVDKNGHVPPSTMGFMRGCVNFMRPEVKAHMLNMAKELASEFKHLPNFRGINWTAYFGGSWQPSFRGTSSDPLALGYGDFTVALFEKETGIKVPGTANDPKRFAERYKFLTSPKIKPHWLVWRAAKLCGFFVELDKTVKSVRNDLNCIAGCDIDFNHIIQWKKSRKSFKEYLLENSWDMEFFKKHQGIWLMPWLFGNARYGYYVGKKLSDQAMGWQGNIDEEFYQTFADKDKRALMLSYRWHEVERVAALFPCRKDWPRSYQQTMAGQQREEMAMEPYTQGMIGFDPQLIAFGFTDVSLYIGVEEMRRKFSRIFRRLPRKLFKKTLNTGFKTNIALRALKQGDEYYFYAVNPGYWPITGKIKLSGKAEVIDLVSGKKVASGTEIKFALEPFGIAAWKAKSGSVGLIGWNNDPVPEDQLAHMKKIIAKARKIMNLSGIKKYLGNQDYNFFKDSTDKAETAIKAGRYAEAWMTLINAHYWGILFEKGKDAKYAGNVGPRKIVATEAEKAPVIDGKLDDEIWEKCIGQTRFISGSKQPSKLETWVYTAWKGNKLYMGFRCLDKNPEKIRASAKQELDIFRGMDDAVDFVIKPPGKHYYQFAFNIKGKKFDQKCLSMLSKDYDYAPDWIVKAAAGANGWTAEVEVDTEKAFGVKIAKGSDWMINFHRFFRMKEHQYSSWVWTPNLHFMDHMGLVRFAGANLLVNPSAETLEKNWPVNWTWSGGIGKKYFTCEPSDVERHSGKYSVMLKFNGFRGKRPRMGAYLVPGGFKYRPTLPLVPGKTYTISFWMKSNIPAISVYLLTANSKGKLRAVTTKMRIKPKPGWNYYSGTVKVPANVKFAAPAFSLHGAEKPMPKPWSGLPLINNKTVMFIDDVMIIEQSGN